MSTKDDGGSAFPQHLSDAMLERGGNEAHGNGGMTLRDWIAGMALQGLLVSCNSEKAREWLSECGKEPQKAVADAAYNIADAMLEARKQ